ncbi:hypothetical protein ALC53_08589 [Atta colombica]|uniref:Uncharacterized protein n=1 Tax=Atta colombica TaxID=520822 RepID=A0A151I2G2_9HYME|nr:hypothetical protein ALC53_08589 [Atta colombica]
MHFIVTFECYLECQVFQSSGGRPCVCRQPATCCCVCLSFNHLHRQPSQPRCRLDGADRFPCEQTDPTGTRLSNLQIRVVNAFRQGLDTRYGEHSSTTLAEVLRKQSSLSKRLSQTSSIEYADNIPDELTIPEIDVERLSSHSHTETAV